MANGYTFAPMLVGIILIATLIAPFSTAESNDVGDSNDDYDVGVDCSNLENEYIQNSNASGEPPFWGTIFVDENISTDSDPSSFINLTYQGQDEREMYDRRSGWIVLDAHIFEARYEGEIQIEIQVNPEFSLENAQFYADFYAPAIGRIPAFLKKDVETVWIHDGDYSFGGGNNNLLIHTVQGDNYISDGILDETFLHEATHTSFDSYHKDESDWILAQEMDEGFISKYAEDYPEREDLAETMLLYLAYRFWPERITQETFETIESTIPNRIMYLDCQSEVGIDVLEVLGCTDAVANNHDPSATEEDGTCDYDLDDDGFNDELEDHCLSDPLDPSSTPEDNDSDGVCDELDDDDDGDGVNDIDEVLGCTDAVANNHNHLATEEDGTCDYDLDNDGVNDIDEVLGCTNPVANNYDPMATDHEKTCDYDLDDDGVNDIDEVTGCTDSSADNFNPSATDEDGSCYYLTPLPPLSVGDEVEVDGVWACISEVNTNYILLDYLNGSDAEPVFYEMPKFDLVKKSNGGVLDCSGEGEEDPDCCEPPEPSEPVPGWGALLAASVLLLASMVRSRRSESVD